MGLISPPLTLESSRSDRNCSNKIIVFGIGGGAGGFNGDLAMELSNMSLDWSIGSGVSCTNVTYGTIHGIISVVLVEQESPKLEVELQPQMLR